MGDRVMKVIPIPCGEVVTTTVISSSFPYIVKETITPCPFPQYITKLCNTDSQLE